MKNFHFISVNVIVLLLTLTNSAFTLYGNHYIRDGIDEPLSDVTTKPAKLSASSDAVDLSISSTWVVNNEVDMERQESGNLVCSDLVLPDAMHNPLIACLEDKLLIYPTGGGLPFGALIFSEYLEGSGNNKCLEIFNATTTSVDLSTCSVQIFSNGNITASSNIALTGVLESGAVHVLCSANANEHILAKADQTSTSSFFNGDDAVVLTYKGIIQDIIGNIGCDPGPRWGTTTFGTQNLTLVRSASVTDGISIDPANSSCNFPTLNSAWVSLPLNDISNLGSHSFSGTIPGVVYNFYNGDPENGGELLGSGNNYTLVTHPKPDFSSIWITTNAIDFEDCESDAVEIKLAYKQPSIVTASKENPSCPGADNGSISLNVAEGELLTYAWTGAGTVPHAKDQDGLKAGNYKVVVTNEDGCSSELEISLTDGDDTTQPVFECPGPLVFDLTPGNLCCKEIEMLDFIIAGLAVSDNCEDFCESLEIKKINGPDFPALLQPLTTTEYIFEATDCSGNTSRCTIPVHVNPYLLTDQGGKYWNYIDDPEDGVIAQELCPDSPDSKIKIEFQMFDLAAGDFFLIFDGDDLSAFDIDGGNGVSESPGEITATCGENESGCLTFIFAPNGDSIKGAGWIAKVRCMKRDIKMDCPDDISLSSDCASRADFTVPDINIECGPDLYDDDDADPLTPDKDLLPNIDYFAALYAIIDGEEKHIRQLNIEGHTFLDPITDGLSPNGKQQYFEYILRYELPLGKTKFTCGNKIRLYPSSVICNDEVRIALGSNCTAALTPDDLLENPCGSDLEAYYHIVIKNEKNEPIPNNTLTGNHLGQQLKAIITDPFDVSCKTDLTLEDNIPPYFNPIASDYIWCTQGDTHGPGELNYQWEALPVPEWYSYFGDNCDVQLTSEAWQLERECSDEFLMVEGVNYQIIGRWVKNWIVVQSASSQLSATQTQTVYILQALPVAPSDVRVSVSVKMDNKNGNAPSPETLLELENGAKYLPHFIDQKNGKIPFSINNHNSCKWILNYHDSNPVNIDCGFKIFRTWMVYNWCDDANAAILEEWPQVIKIIDNVKPEIVCPQADGTGSSVDNAYRVGTGNNPFVCDATVELSHPLVNDIGDSDPISELLGIFEVSQNKLISKSFSSLSLNGKCEENYYAMYRAVDRCGNISDTCRTYFTVFDDGAPVAIAEEFSTLSLDDNNKGIVSICADDLDSGSYDNCTEELTFLIAKSENDVFRTCLELSCADFFNEGQVDCTSNTTLFFKAVDQCANESTIMVKVAFNNTWEEPKPVELATISGTIETEAGVVVEAVKVEVADTEMPIVATDVEGVFSFLAPKKGTYTIVPEKDTDPLNGVSTFDIILISQHILGTRQLTGPYQMIAADVNNSGSITSADLVLLRQLILNKISQFTNNTSWRFVDKAFKFANPDNPWAQVFPESISVDMSEFTLANFIGIKTGDVDGSGSANSLLTTGSRSIADHLDFQMEDRILKAGEEHRIDFYASDMANIKGYQFALEFDEEVITFIDLQIGALPQLSRSNFNLTKVEEGVITTSWNSNEEMRLSPNEVLFRLSVKAKDNIQLSEELNINSQYLSAEAYDSDLRQMELKLVINNMLTSTGKFELYQNIPNPFTKETRIGFTLPKSGSATLSIYDVTGRLCFNRSDDYTKGYNEVIIEGQELPVSGILYYKLQTADSSVSRKMILIGR